MNTAAERALQRLTDPTHPATDSLAKLIVAQANRRPLSEVASPEWLAKQWTLGLRTALRSGGLKSLLEEGFTTLQSHANDSPRTARDLLSTNIIDALEDALRRPINIDEEVLFQVLDQSAVRGLVREILMQGIRGFRATIKSVDSGVLSGTVSRAAKRGRGLLGGLNAVTGNLAGVASDVVGAVREEVEGQFDQRVRDHARDVARSNVRAIAKYLADPEQAEAFGEFRVAALNVLLDIPSDQILAAIQANDPEAIIDELFDAVQRTVEQEDFEENIQSAVRRVYDGFGDETLEHVLEELGLTDTWNGPMIEWVSAQLRHTFESDSFATWLNSLLQD